MTDEQDKLAQEWADALQQDLDDDDEKAPAGEDKSSDEALADEWAAALAEAEQGDMTGEKESAFMDTQLKPAEFKDMSEQAKGPAPENVKRDLEFILDIPLEVSAELGRTKLLINELLQLGQGSVVELNKLAGEPLEIYVNGKLVARGEAVVINEKFGIRLTDIISPIERVKQLA
jgi:flagellar motor switch protein FliN/FliY